MLSLYNIAKILSYIYICVYSALVLLKDWKLTFNDHSNQTHIDWNIYGESGRVPDENIGSL